MAVTDVEAIPVEVGIKPLEEPLGVAPYASNHDEISSRTRLLVRVDTDEGVTGWGEMLVAMQSAEATKAVIDHVIAPELVGRDLDDIRGFVESFYYPYAKVRPFVGAVETALWDAFGKRLGASLSALLGGAVREEVPVAFCLGILDPERSAAKAREAHDAGFRTLKTKAGPEYRLDVERLRAMHEAVGGDLEFRLDPNRGWGFEEAVRAIARLEDAGIYLQYVEQPCRIDTFGTYAKLRERLRTPVAVNEDTYFPENLFHLAKADAIDAAVVDLVPAGGVLALRDQAAVAASAGVSLAHHNGFDLGIKQAAVLHLAASTPALNLAPDSVYYAWDDHVLEEPLAVDGGAMAVPDGPGLGVEVDEAKVDRYRVD